MRARHSAVALAFVYAVCRAFEWVVRELLGLVLFCVAGACLWLFRVGLGARAGAGGARGSPPGVLESRPLGSASRCVYGSGGGKQLAGVVYCFWGVSVNS